MLVIMSNVDIDEEKAKYMKDHNLLFLQTEPNADGKEGSADAKYIYKQYDVQGAEAYKDRIFNNILLDRKSTRLNSSHVAISYAVFCLKKKKNYKTKTI